MIVRLRRSRPEDPDGVPGDDRDAPSTQLAVLRRPSGRRSDGPDRPRGTVVGWMGEPRPTGVGVRRRAAGRGPAALRDPAVPGSRAVLPEGRGGCPEPCVSEAPFQGSISCEDG
jgi:hypothetical protein